MKKVDLRIRSWTKSFTWRFIGIIILLPLTYIFTGTWEGAAKITLVFHAIRMMLYYVHERIWERISWGRGDGDSSRLPFYMSFIILIISFLLIIIYSFRGES